MTLAGSAFATAPLWYLTRSTAIVAFVLLTLTTVLGIAATQRALASPAWPRFATQRLHRNLSLLGAALIGVHIVTTVVDGYVPIGWSSVLVPGTSSYSRLGVGLGTLALDLLVVLVVTSLARRHLSHRVWRALHWTAYGLWPLALVHFLTTGTDARHGRWGLWLALFSLAAVGTAVLVRLSAANHPRPVRSVAGSAR